ncbi:hypothetical protein L6R52_17370 [Myxococcota bacterium]|nr:hypothetical protein [Myxococcota bacterium]
MKNVPLLVQKTLLAGDRILAELPPRHPNARLPTALRRPAPPRWYCARYFEVETWLVEEEIDFEDSQLLFDERHDCRTLDELDQILGRWIDDPREFVHYRDYEKKLPF